VGGHIPAGEGQRLHPSYICPADELLWSGWGLRELGGSLPGGFSQTPADRHHWVKRGSSVVRCGVLWCRHGKRVRGRDVE